MMVLVVLMIISVSYNAKTVYDSAFFVNNAVVFPQVAVVDVLTEGNHLLYWETLVESKSEKDGQDCEVRTAQWWRSRGWWLWLRLLELNLKLKWVDCNDAEERVNALDLIPKQSIKLAFSRFARKMWIRSPREDADHCEQRLPDLHCHLYLLFHNQPRGLYAGIEAHK